MAQQEAQGFTSYSFWASNSSAPGAIEAILKISSLATGEGRW